MTDKKCPLGEDCDLTIAWMVGAERAKSAYTARIEALEAKLAKAVEALKKSPDVVRHTTLDDGPRWPEDRLGVWLAALDACTNVTQAHVNATLAELTGGKDD